MSESVSEKAKSFRPDEESAVFYYNKKREIVDDDFTAVAKLSAVKKDGEEKYTFYLRKSEGDIYDPYGVRQITKSTIQLYPYKKVDKEVFDLYFEYLKTRKDIYLIKAKREDINQRR